MLLLGLILVYSSCKDAVENAIDCSVETLYLNVHADVDTINPLLVHFTFVNNDTIDNRFTLDQNITWDFDDGNKETVSALEISHTYSDAGTYNVKAYYTLSNGSSSCSSNKEISVTLQ